MPSTSRPAGVVPAAVVLHAIGHTAWMLPDDDATDTASHEPATLMPVPGSTAKLTVQLQLHTTDAVATVSDYSEAPCLPPLVPSMLTVHQLSSACLVRLKSIASSDFTSLATFASCIAACVNCDLGKEAFAVKPVSRMLTNTALARGICLSEAHWSEPLHPWRGINVLVAPHDTTLVFLDLTWFMRTGVPLHINLLRRCAVSDPDAAVTVTSVSAIEVNEQGLLLCSLLDFKTLVPGLLSVLLASVPCSGAYVNRRDGEDMHNLLGDVGHVWMGNKRGQLHGITEALSPGALQVSTFTLKHFAQRTLCSTNCDRWISLSELRNACLACVSLNRKDKMYLRRFIHMLTALRMCVL
jgi:hypothetical protein